MIALRAELFLTLCADDLDDAAFDDVRRIARYEAVDHTGAADQSDLTDGEREQRPLYAAVQFAARHHLRKAVAAPKLLLQFFLIESLSLEGIDLYRVIWQSVAFFRHLCKRANGHGRGRKLLQPEGILQFCPPGLSDTQHRYLLEFPKFTLGKAPDGKIIKIVHKDTADIRR